jgi:hypothetical protein
MKLIEINFTNSFSTIYRRLSHHQQFFVTSLVAYFLFDQKWLNHIKRKGSRGSFLEALLIVHDLDDLLILIRLIYDKLLNQAFFSLLLN